MKFTLMIMVLVMLLPWESRGRNLDVEEEDQGTPEATVQKRAFWQFGRMVKCATGRRAWDYNGYGNWCGRGGRGTPVDGVDRCCMVHDHCWDRLVHCRPYSNKYSYSVSDRHPSCSITCNAGNNDSCEQSICNCDKAAAECFARNTYNPNNKH